MINCKIRHISSVLLSRNAPDAHRLTKAQPSVWNSSAPVHRLSHTRRTTLSFHNISCFIILSRACQGGKREKIWTFPFLRSNLHLLLISQSLPLTRRILMKGRARALLGSRRTWRQERMQAGDGTAATISIWVQSVCRLLKWMFK